MRLFLKYQHQLTGKQGSFSTENFFDEDINRLMVIGKSGSGKSTLLNIIAGKLTPDSGEVIIGNQTFLDSKKKFVLPVSKRRVGYVFQENLLFPHLKVKENLLFSKASKKYKYQDEVIEILDIQHILDQYPYQLSGGEKKRIAIGRSILSDPLLLLLDEPLTALDPETKANILHHLLEINNHLHLPMIWVTHCETELSTIAQRVIVMSQGKQTFLGNLSEWLSIQETNPSEKIQPKFFQKKHVI